MHAQKLVIPLVALGVSAFAGYYLGNRHADFDSAQSNAGQTEVACLQSSSITKMAEPSTSPALFKDARLLAQVSGLQKDFSVLREKYEQLRHKSQLEKQEQQELQALPDLVKASLEQLPMELIAPIIEKHVSIPMDVLANMSDQRAFVDRLADVAMEDIVDESDVEQEPILGPVDFTRYLRTSAPQDVFYTSDLVVFAEFDSYSFSRTEVLIKWFRVNDGQILLFKQMPINNNDSNHVWIKDDDGLEPGNYKVEVYEISQEMPLLSVGKYRVESVL
jgi:hypothetical protein